MEITSRGAEQEIKLTDVNEVDALSFATHIREHSIPWFDVMRRGTRRDLRVLTHDLRVAINPELAVAERPLALNGRQSSLALEALRWVVRHDESKPEGVIDDMQKLLDEAEYRVA